MTIGYKILIERDRERLEIAVNDELMNDWQPLGAPFINGSFNCDIWHQTMIKEADNA